VADIASRLEPNTNAAQFSKDKFTYIFGSTWEKDERYLIRFINECDTDARFIIAPHEINESHIQFIVNRLDKKTVRYSKLSGEDLSKYRVLIIDSIGLLASLYRYANVAYIGGGFGKGIHNILEPAVHGIPVVFGPNYHKFREATELVRDEGAFPVNNYKELTEIFTLLVNNRVVLKNAGGSTRQFVQRNLGATEVILSYLKKN
jgi:3-deoxy-D-manno-octulosonic-acid transferase